MEPVVQDAAPYGSGDVEKRNHKYCTAVYLYKYNFFFWILPRLDRFLGPVLPNSPNSKNQSKIKNKKNRDE